METGQIVRIQYLIVRSFEIVLGNMATLCGAKKTTNLAWK